MNPLKLPTEMPLLFTNRLTLRPFALEDAPAVYAMANNKKIYDTTLNIPHPYTLEMASQWIDTHADSAMEQQLYHWAIVETNTKTLLGCISISLKANRFLGEIGYWIGEPHWSNGFGTEAAQALIDYAFNEMGLNRIYGRHFTENPASGAIMTKCGMKDEGCLRHDQYKNGKFIDIAYKGILKSDYLASR